MKEIHKMAPFDIIDTTSLGYRMVWQEKKFLAEKAAIPYIVKVTFLVLVVLFDFTGDFIKQALLLLPVFFAEGWVMAIIARMIFFGTDAGNKHFSAGRQAMGGIVMYALIKFLQTGSMGLFIAPGSTEAVSRSAEMTYDGFILAFLILVVSVWAFKFLWVYIPLSVNFTMRSVFSLLKGPFLSLYMIGVWLVCMVPFFLLMMLITGPLVDSWDTGEIPFTAKIVIISIQAALDLTAMSVATASLSYAFRFMIEDRSKQK